MQTSLMTITLSPVTLIHQCSRDTILWLIKEKVLDQVLGLHSLNQDGLTQMDSKIISKRLSLLSSKPFNQRIEGKMITIIAFWL